ncbi:hypothetical protein [Enterococcus sp. AZ109]|uniref:hypothetical protein n=1 Tax=Enterococcus sp. AZ109 TaxID=2774634 RepID=UPI003F1F02C0
MKYKNYFPILLFLSIPLLLPLTWYRNIDMSQELYFLIDYSGFQVFSLEYPVIHLYLLSLLCLFLSFYENQLYDLTKYPIVVFFTLVALFPAIKKWPLFSILFFQRFGLTSLLVMILALLTLYSIHLIQIDAEDFGSFRNKGAAIRKITRSSS